MSKWNKVEDVKPSDGQQVWVAYKFPVPVDEGGDRIHQGYAIWDEIEGWWFDVDTDGTLIGRKYCIENELLAATITHWMPLPDDPSDDH
jgi:hypothetical protein